MSKRQAPKPDRFGETPPLPQRRGGKEVESGAVVDSVEEVEIGAVVDEEVERARLREKPIPKGAALVFDLALTNKRSQLSKMRVAKNRHIPAG